MFYEANLGLDTKLSTQLEMSPERLDKANLVCIPFSGASGSPFFRAFRP